MLEDDSIRIIKTSVQAERERREKESFMNMVRVCPECGKRNDYLVMSSEISESCSMGFFRSPKIVRKSVYRFTCRYCGCEWEGSRRK